MRALCVLILLGLTSAASAQPVSYAFKGDVPIGEKPQIRITAAEPVSEVKVALKRSDGKLLTLKGGTLAKGKSVTLSIGDGAAGKVSYTGTISAKAGAAGLWKEDFTLDTTVRGALKVAYDADHLDLEKHVLQFKPTREIKQAELVVVGEDGKDLATASQRYDSAPADGWYSISWSPQNAATRVMMLKLKVIADETTASNLELIPWSVEIAHEDVNFATDSAVIEPGEEKKLDASLAKINEAIKRSEKFIKMRLYVAGHTDTVGENGPNRKLSNARAKSIAAYFRKKGLRLPIAFAGFGEDVLKVKTANNTDERLNRRADYVLGPAGGSPPFKGPYLKAQAQWMQLK
jgi:outer membrane protein OmpA-like peptidoglycan-associated protein